MKPISAADLEVRLGGWAAFWRRRLGYDQTGSFEGQYRSPQRDHWEPPKTRAYLGEIDDRDAEAIESAVCALDLFHHTLLKAWYVRRQSEAECLACSRLAAGYARSRWVGRNRAGANSELMKEFQAAMAMAKLLLTAELALPATVRKKRASTYVRKILGLEPLTSVALAVC